MSAEYMLGKKPDLAREQLAHLVTLFDPQTKDFLNGVGVTPGMRCLDIGAGSGSIAGWLAAQVGPGGSVVAADLNTDHLVAEPGVTVQRHDLNDGVPPGGPFDLIHARLVLMHLSRRREIVSELAAGLVPGGWLVLGESTRYGTRPQDVIATSRQGDTALFNRVVRTTFDRVGGPGGIDYEWVYGVDGCLADAGLVDVHGAGRQEVRSGGQPGALLTANYIRQAESFLLDAGVSEADLTRFAELAGDPGFRSWGMPLLYVAGRKPAA